MPYVSPQVRLDLVARMVGKTFGHLTVVGRGALHTTAGGRKLWRLHCVCSCGKIVTPFVWDVAKGATISCGHHPRYADRSLPAFNYIYDHVYKGRALKAGLPFKLTRDQFRNLCEQDCHYCGTSPSNESYRGRRGTITTGKLLSSWVYNGLDRLDSAKGYTPANVVPCCGTCNHAKHTMPYERFTAWLDRIAAFRAQPR